MTEICILSFILITVGFIVASLGASLYDRDMIGIMLFSVGVAAGATGITMFCFCCGR